MTEPTADSLLMGGGATFFTFAAKNSIGQFVTKPYGPQNPTKVAGTVASIGEPQQQTDYSSNALQTWPDGKPKLQFAITLDVDWNNTFDWQNPDAWQRVGPADANDTQRGVMIKQSSQLQGALRDAIKEAGASNLALGAYVVVEMTGEQASTKGNPQKIYAVTYQPPAQGVVMEQPQMQAAQQVPAQMQQAHSAQIAASVMPQNAPVAQPAQVQPQAVPQQVQPTAGAAPPAPSQNDPFEIGRKLLHEMKLSPEQVAATTGLTIEQVNQLPPF